MKCINKGLKIIFHNTIQGFIRTINKFVEEKKLGFLEKFKVHNNNNILVIVNNSPTKLSKLKNNLSNLKNK